MKSYLHGISEWHMKYLPLVSIDKWFLWCVCIQLWTIYTIYMSVSKLCGCFYKAEHLVLCSLH